MSTEQLVGTGLPASVKSPRRPPGRGQLRRLELRWGLAFVAPYAAVFLFFFAYPFVYALWMAAKPSLYADLIADPRYLSTVINTLVFVGFGVNVKMFLALLLSGFFLRRRWWIKALLAVYVLPWLIAAAQACISFHWMLQQQGLIDGLLSGMFDIDGPIWLNDRWMAVAANIVAYIWKWMPFWTVIFLAARMTIPRNIYDSAEIDGANGIRCFVHITFPVLANLYLVCTLLSTLWTLGDFTTVFIVSGGGPSGYSDVLATLGFHYAFDAARPGLGVAAVMSALPVLIPVVILLMRRFQTREVRI